MQDLINPGRIIDLLANHITYNDYCFVNHLNCIDIGKMKLVCYLMHNKL